MNSPHLYGKYKWGLFSFGFFQYLRKNWTETGEYGKIQKTKRGSDMKLIVCLDKQNGMLFNHRRQSRDRMVIADILETVGDAVLWVSAYSARLFPAERVRICTQLPAGTEDYCFAEDLLPDEMPQELTVYRWNRVYPADTFFPLQLSQWKQISFEEFAGFSHEIIAKECYVK